MGAEARRGQAKVGNKQQRWLTIGRNHLSIYYGKLISLVGVTIAARLLTFISGSLFMTFLILASGRAGCLKSGVSCSAVSI